MVTLENKILMDHEGAFRYKNKLIFPETMYKLYADTYTHNIQLYSLFKYWDREVI